MATRTAKVTPRSPASVAKSAKVAASPRQGSAKRGTKLTVVPDVDPIESWLEALPEQYRKCRGRKRHNFDAYTVGWRHWENIWVYEETEQCPDCTTQRHRYVHAEIGSVLVPWEYRYPKGYLMPAGAGQASEDVQNTLRLRRIKRVLKGGPPKRA